MHRGQEQCGTRGQFHEDRTSRPARAVGHGCGAGGRGVRGQPRELERSQQREWRRRRRPRRQLRELAGDLVGVLMTAAALS